MRLLAFQSARRAVQTFFTELVGGSLPDLCSCTRRQYRGLMVLLSVCCFWDREMSYTGTLWLRCHTIIPFFCLSSALPACVPCPADSYKYLSAAKLRNDKSFTLDAVETALLTRLTKPDIRE